MLGYLHSVTSGLFGKWTYRELPTLFDSLWMILYIGLHIFSYRDIGVYIIHYIGELSVQIPNTYYFTLNFIFSAFTNSRFVVY
jgi:hypothetical protein